jgi:carboxypeptidase Q
MLAALAPCLAILIPAALGQNTPINPPPGFGQIPQGAGACSVEKSCADLAPLMIRSALGPSPLEANLRTLTGSPAEGPAVAWAVEALRRAGVDEVHTEKFTVNRASGPLESENVVGEIRGREKSDEFVLLGAHLGSRDLGTFALDNGCDVAMVIDAARVIHASGNIPRRSIRFVLFGGEEQGESGSRAYAHAHRAEFDRMVAAVIYDSGARRVTGYSLSGRKDLLAGAREAMEPLKSLGLMEFTFDVLGRPDNLDFVLEGVPTLVANRDAANHVLKDGAASGALDKASISELKRSVAIAAVTAYALADAAARIGHRQTRAEVGQLLKDSGLEETLKTEGAWTEWEKGERGRQP